MPASAQYYLSCSQCGSLATVDGGDKKQTLYAETETCVREEAVDEGWHSNATDTFLSTKDIIDYCPDCVAKGFTIESKN